MATPLVQTLRRLYPELSCLWPEDWEPPEDDGEIEPEGCSVCGRVLVGESCGECESPEVLVEAAADGAEREAEG